MEQAPQDEFYQADNGYYFPTNVYYDNQMVPIPMQYMYYPHPMPVSVPNEGQIQFGSFSPDELEKVSLETIAKKIEAECQAEKDALISSTSARLIAMQTVVDQANSNKAAAEARVESLAGRITELVNSNDKLRGEAQVLERQNKALVTEKKQLEEKVANMESESNAFYKHSTKQAATNADLQEKLEAAHKQIASLKESVKPSKVENKQAERQMVTTSAELMALKTTIKKFKSSLEAEEMVTKSLKEKNDSLLTQISSKDKEMVTMANTLANAEESSRRVALQLMGMINLAPVCDSLQTYIESNFRRLKKASKTEDLHVFAQEAINQIQQYDNGILDRMLEKIQQKTKASYIEAAERLPANAGKVDPEKFKKFLDEEVEGDEKIAELQETVARIFSRRTAAVLVPNTVGCNVE